MYDYPHYKEHNKKELVAFMMAHPFIVLAGFDQEKRIEATQVPVLVKEKDGKIIIEGHMARKSGHHQAFEKNADVLALFTGPHTYVSGTWYSGNPQQASTWNYISIHARGKIKFLGFDELVDILRKLSLHFEGYDHSSSTFYDNLPVDYREKLMKAIVAFEIEVTELENVFKLSQNRDEKSYDRIMMELKKQGGDAREIGELMEKRKPGVFPK